jgi:hypothetical protein
MTYTNLNHYWNENKSQFLRQGISKSDITRIWTDAVHTTATAINQNIIKKLDRQ